MGFIPQTIYSLEARTSAPAATDSEVDLQSKGASVVRAVLRVTNNASTTGPPDDQVLSLQGQDSDDGSTWAAVSGLLIVFDGARHTAAAGFRRPLEFRPERRYFRWSPVHTGTTPGLTWSLHHAYLGA